MGAKTGLGSWRRAWPGRAGQRVLAGMALALLAAACAPDASGVRARYPHDFTFVSGYYSEQQAAPYWEVGQIELAGQYAALASRDIRGGNVQWTSLTYRRQHRLGRWPVTKAD